MGDDEGVRGERPTHELEKVPNGLLLALGDTAPSGQGLQPGVSQPRGCWRELRAGPRRCGETGGDRGPYRSLEEHGGDRVRPRI